MDRLERIVFNKRIVNIMRFIYSVESILPGAVRLPKRRKQVT